jgi:hypothetical protein
MLQPPYSNAPETSTAETSTARRRRDMTARQCMPENSDAPGLRLKAGPGPGPRGVEIPDDFATVVA